MRRFIDDSNSCRLREFISSTRIFVVYENSFVAIENNSILRRLRANVTIIVLSLLDKIFLGN